MAALTIDQLKARLTAYLAAEVKILEGQSYQIGDRRLQRADLSEVRSEISRLEAQINQAERSAATGGRSSIRYARPC